MRSLVSSTVRVDVSTSAGVVFGIGSCGDGPPGHLGGGEEDFLCWKMQMESNIIRPDKLIHTC